MAVRDINIGPSFIGCVNTLSNLTRLTLNVDAFGRSGHVPLLLHLLKNVDATSLDALNYGTITFTEDINAEMVNELGRIRHQTHIKESCVYIVVRPTSLDSLKFVSDLVSFAIDSCPLLKSFSL